MPDPLEEREDPPPGPPSLPPPRVRPHLITTLAELGHAVALLMDQQEFVVDVETDGRRPVENNVTWVGLASHGLRFLIPMGHPNGDLVREAYSDKEPDLSTVRPYKNDPNRFTKPKMRTVHHPAEFTAPPVQLTQEEVFPLIRPLFFRSNMSVIGHNLKYDLMSVAKYFDALPTTRCVDTLVLQYLLDENKRAYSLKNLTAEWALGKAAMNPEVRKAFYPELGKGGIDNFSCPDVAKYLAKDISYTWWMYLRLMPLLERYDLTDAFDLEMRLYPVLMEMELAGIQIDTTVLEELQEKVHADLQQLKIDMFREAGREFELKPNDKRAVLFDPKSEGGQGLKPLSFTEKQGKPQVNDTFLEKYKDENALVRALYDHTKLEKLRGTFVDKFLEPGLLVDGRVHGSLNQHRAETGRLSSSDPNLQQIPARTDMGREFRKAFVASPGYTMFVADYSQIELRCAAHLSKDPELSRVLIEGEDLHTAAASAAFGIPPEEVTSDQRAVGKTMNFLILYGGGAKRLAAQIGGTKDDAQTLIDNYFSVYKKLPVWKDYIVRSAWEYGTETGMPTTFIPPYRRRRRVPSLFSDDSAEVWSAQRQLVNSVVQGFAANIMKMALINVSEGLQHWDARLLMTVHDELIGEAREDIAEDIFKGVLSDMENVTYDDGKPILGDIPLVAEGGLGHNWVESK